MKRLTKFLLRGWHMQQDVKEEVAMFIVSNKAHIYGVVFG